MAEVAGCQLAWIAVGLALIELFDFAVANSW
jgi:hypothetical protein